MRAITSISTCVALLAGLAFTPSAEARNRRGESATESNQESRDASESSFRYEAITSLTFGSDGTLYVGDSGTGHVHAVATQGAAAEAQGQGYNLQDIDTSMAELLGTTPRNLRVRDLAVHPHSSEAYIAVARPSGDTLHSVIVIMNQAGDARLLTDAPMASSTLPFAPANDFLFYDDFPSRDLSITDLEVFDGHLYVAGMSNADFASTLWTLDLPLEAEAAVTTVEMFHGVHDQMETRAPIRTMAIAEIAGEPTLIAAYTCTPLVAFPLADIVAGAHITGKTIAELGYGNTPGDLILFDGQDMEQNPVPMLFIQNKNQSAQVIPMAAVADAIAGPGITSALGLSRVDLGASEVPMTGILQIDDQDPGHLLAIRRDAEEGDLELVSYLKNVYFRLSDFQSEYEVPGYVYAPEQEPTRNFQNMMKMDEGHASAVNE